MAEDLITSLSHIRWLMVIARNSSFVYKGRNVDARQIGRDLNVRYLLEGSVRRTQKRVRLTVQLIDAESGAHLWADKFDGEIDDIFEFQDQITASVVGAIEPSLRGAEIERATRKRPDNLTAYDLYLRALPFAYAHTPEGRTTALALLGKALAIDPNYAEAHGLAVWCHLQRLLNESPQSAADRASAFAHAKAVVAAGSQDAATLAFAAHPYAMLIHDYETSTEMIDRALAYNPSCAHAQCLGAVINAWAGRYDKAISLAERAVRFSPFDPIRHLALAALARSKLFQGRPEEALIAARRAVQANPRHLPSRGYMIICLVQLGRLQELRETVQRLLEDFPNATLAHFTTYATFEPFTAELNTAGLPE
jgi:tetratricopeptide (TPR) repeat protein